MFEAIKAYDNLIEKTSNLIRTLKIYPKVFEKDEHEYLHAFFDRNLYNALCQLDLIIGLKYLDVSQAVNNKIEANYFGRIVAHSSHEILDDLNKMVGRDIRNYVIDKHEKSYLDKIDSSVKSLNKIKKDYFKTLKEIRHNLFGHKLKEGHQQAEMIVKVDNKEIYKIGNEIFKKQNDLLKNFIELIEKI